MCPVLLDFIGEKEQKGGASLTSRLWHGNGEMDVRVGKGGTVSCFESPDCPEIDNDLCVTVLVWSVPAGPPVIWCTDWWAQPLAYDSQGGQRLTSQGLECVSCPPFLVASFLEEQH